MKLIWNILFCVDCVFYDVLCIYKYNNVSVELYRMRKKEIYLYRKRLSVLEGMKKGLMFVYYFIDKICKINI